MSTQSGRNYLQQFTDEIEKMGLNTEENEMWHRRVKLWVMDLTEPEALKTHLARGTANRHADRDLLNSLRERNVLREEVDIDEAVSKLYSLIIGATLEILRDPTEQTRQYQLAILDTYVDSIIRTK